MRKTKIEWTDYSWNPIKGICPTGCWYCYARRMYKRFKWNPELRWEIDVDSLLRFKPKAGSKIFTCSTIELFHAKIKKEWRDDLFKIIEMNPCFIFQILTKFPQNIDRPMPENVWLGATVENSDTAWRGILLSEYYKAKVKFVSMEPMLGYPGFPFFRELDWIIIGRLTQYGRKYDPKRTWIERIINQAKEHNIPIFLKDNLKRIWEGPLMQKFPNEE